MNNSSNWHVTKWKCIANFDVGFCTALHDHANFETLRSQDVCLRTVGVMQQCNATCAVWVVLDGSNFCFVLIGDALEVDDAVLLLVSTTLVT